MKINFPFRFVALVVSLLLRSLAAGAEVDIPLTKITGPNNAVSDAEHGVSLTYPAGWSVKRGVRWGKNNDKTTIVLQRTQPTWAAVSFFYQKFDAESQRPPEIKDWFRSSIRDREAAKQKEFRDYRNDPRSLTYRTTASGFPMCSYMATFSGRSDLLIEYFVRVAGATTYVMFVTQGTRSQIEAWRADIDQMADTVRLP